MMAKLLNESETKVKSHLPERRKFGGSNDTYADDEDGGDRLLLLIARGRCCVVYGVVRCCAFVVRTVETPLYRSHVVVVFVSCC